MMFLVILACSAVKATDRDEDGWLSSVDCDDLNPFINPGADEIPGDGADNDCSLQTRDDDYDQDGWVGFQDCDDNDPTVPGVEVPYDGVDNDCDPLTLDDDLDGDGAVAADDCDDTDPEVSLVEDELPYDGIDNDCDPDTPDDDLDGDGFGVLDDCDDGNPFVTTDAVWYEDCDGDGYAAEGAAAVALCDPTGEPACGGTGSWTSIEPSGTPSSPTNNRIDCADLDPAVHPGQTNFFTLPISGVPLPYDYDCDGEQLPIYGVYTCTVAPGTSACSTVAGFLDEVGCGVRDTLFTSCLTVSASECLEQGPAPQTRQACR